MFISILFICEAGERVTTQFEAFAKELEQCNWYGFSIRMQRLYVFFLLDTQQPVNIQSYAGIQCTRDTFKNVINIHSFES